MFDISFEINGRKVNPNNIGDALQAAVLSGVAESVKSSIGSIRCSEHGQAPKVKIKGRNIDNLSFDVSGCCESLISKVEAKLK
jgi:hypothetical protein